MTKIDSILFPEGKMPPVAASCDHYAGNEKLILKSLDTQNLLGPIFDITCDLEDGAQIGAETTLRNRIIEIINSDLNKYNQVGIRVHDFTSPFFEDDIQQCLHAASKRISHITIPKVLSFSQAREIVAFIRKACTETKLTKILPIHLLIETHQALHEVWDIAGLNGLRGLDFGIMDFVSAHLGAIDSQQMISPGQFEHPLISRAKSKISSACIAHGLIPVHNITTSFNDPERTFDDALRARVQFGFLRMWSIHPNQIKQITDAMKPDFQEVQKACSIILLAKAATWGPIRFEDQLHDKASYRYFWTLIKRASKAGVSIPQDAQELLNT